MDNNIELKIQSNIIENNSIIVDIPNISSTPTMPSTPRQKGIIDILNDTKKHFRLTMLKVYTIIIFIFSFIYYFLGSNHISIKEDSYIDCLYFSVTIISTVGFGDIYPITNLGKFVVTIEEIITIVLIGILVI